MDGQFKYVEFVNFSVVLIKSDTAAFMFAPRFVYVPLSECRAYVRPPKGYLKVTFAIIRIKRNRHSESNLVIIKVG